MWQTARCGLRPQRVIVVWWVRSSFTTCYSTMFKDTYWKESSLTLSPNQCFNHRKTWMKQLVNKLTIHYYFLTAVLSRNIIISLSAWNLKSGSGSKLLKIMKLVTCVLFSLLVCSVIFLSSLWLHFTSDFLSLSLSISLPHPAPVFSSSQRDPGSCRWVYGCRLSGRRGLHQPSERDWQAGGGRLGQHGSGVSDCGSHCCLQLLSTWTPPQSCSVYPRNPCHNGGVCVDTQSGYRWESTGFPLRAFLNDFISLHIWRESERDSSEMFITGFL